MIEICSQAISKVPVFPLLQLSVQTSSRLYLVRLTWMKSTAKGSDLENVSMSASLLKCNQCTSYWSSRTNYIRATCKQCVHGKWLVGAHLNEDLSQLSFLAQSRQLTCRRGKAQRVSLEGKRGLDSAFSLHSLLLQYFLLYFRLISAFSSRSIFQFLVIFLFLLFHCVQDSFRIFLFLLFHRA